MFCDTIMIKNYKQIGLLIIFLGVIYNNVFSQEIEPQMEINIDDLGDVSDDFQEYFFEALKQKAITNNEKAIEALEKCIELIPDSPFLYFELGKNQLELKQYQKAEENFKKTLESKPDNKYILEYLYESYFAQQKYSESIKTVEKLVSTDPMFKEQLANLYFLEKRYEESLNILDELIDQYGTDSYREQLRKNISLNITNPNNQISKLESKIKEDPDKEQNYLNLIYLFSQDGQKEKAYETAKSLLSKKPDSELVHLALYKFYLDDNKIEESIQSIKTVMASKKIDAESKHKVINDFLLFLDKNPQYEPQLIEIVNLFSTDQDNTKVYTELGNYYHNKNRKELALNYYEKGIKDNANDFKLLKRIVLLQLDLKRYEKAKQGSELAIEIYPAQPIFYLINGVSLLNLGEAKKLLIPFLWE